MGASYIRKIYLLGYIISRLKDKIKDTLCILKIELLFRLQFYWSDLYSSKVTEDFRLQHGIWKILNCCSAKGKLETAVRQHRSQREKLNNK